jgi:hypothetical protein
MALPSKDGLLAERVASSYQQLCNAASDLNTISDELGNSISQIDAALRSLNLGISVWVDIVSTDDDQTHDYWGEKVGYAKVSGKWGISLCTFSGNYERPEQETGEEWLFNDGPRKLRLSAIEKIPDLLKNLSEEAVKTTERIRGKLAAAQQVATAVKNAATKPVTNKSLGVQK